MKSFQCALCGHRFSHGPRVCESCPLSGGCDLVECPSCGYRFPRRSRLIDLAARLFGKLAGKAS